MAVLGLDLGAKCGFAIDVDGELHSGTWKLTPRANDIDREKETHLWRHIQTLHEEHDITAVAFERVDVHTRPGGEHNTQAGQMYGGYRGIVRMWTDVFKARLEAVPVGTLKKFATGSGRATKAEMIAQADFRWRDQNVTDDNQADALHVLDWMLVEKLGRRTKQTIDMTKQTALPEVDF